MLNTAFLWLALAQQAAPPESFRILNDVTYSSPGGRDLKLDIYLPTDARRPMPLMVWIHGGAWRMGSKDNCPAVWLTNHGYAVASISYRLSQEAQFPAQIDDAQAAVKWLRANAAKYGIDGKRVAVWGASAGGHLAAMLGTMASAGARPQAVVDFFGPSDLVRMNDQPGAMDHNAPDSPESLLIGGPVQQSLDKARAASPLHFVTRDDAPFLIVHGDEDRTVIPSQSHLLYDALQKAGVESTLKMIKGAGHGGKEFNTEEVRGWILAFLKKHLGR